MSEMAQREPAKDDAVDEAPTAELQRLAATRAALDPERRALRADIVLSAIIEYLAVNGESARKTIIEGVRTIWKTGSITDFEIDSALSQGQSIGLINQVRGPNESEHWRATEDAVRESQEDRSWAQMAYQRFLESIDEQLDLRKIDIGRDGRTEIGRRLLTAFANGSLVEGESPILGVNALRPVEFAADRIRAEVAAQQGNELRDVTMELVEIALDPDDEFANELIHLLIVGTVLQTFLSKRDLGVAPDLTGMRLMLDTPILVDLVDESTSSQRIAKELVSMSRRLGIEVVVGNHVIDELERLWTAAVDEHPERLDGRTTVQGFARLISSRYSNPFVRQFVKLKSEGKTLRWSQFKIERSSIRPLLSDLDVRIVQNEYDGDADRECLEGLVTELLRLSADRNTPGSRTRSTARTDATSALMVGRWREEVLMVPCSAYIVSPEHLTEVAYCSVFDGDSVSLIAAWLALVASLVADDPVKRAEIAEVIGNAVFRDSFFGLATAYTLDSAVKLAEMLQEHNKLSLEDSRELARISVSDFLESNAEENDEDAIHAVAMEAILQRSARRDSRARRGIEQANAEVSEKRDEASALRYELGTVQGQLDRVEAARQRDRRTNTAVFVVLVALFAVVVCAVSHRITGRLLGFVSCLWAIVAYLGFHYSKKGRIGIIDGLITLGLAVVAGLLIKFL